MKKIKIIDLLNMIARGEEVQFKIDNYKYYLEKGKGLKDEDDDEVDWVIDEKWLNEEAEIIEEVSETKKVIERIENNIEKIAIEMPVFNRYYEEAPIKPPTNQQLADKLNEVIDKINEMEENNAKN